MFNVFLRPFLCLLLILTTACASNPIKVQVIQDHDSRLDCGGLAQEIDRTEDLKKQARSEDKFMLKHMMIFSAMVSTYNMNKAESNAVKRIEHLQELYNQKQCYLQQNVNNNPYQPLQQPPMSNYNSMPMPGNMPQMPTSNEGYLDPTMVGGGMPNGAFDDGNMAGFGTYPQPSAMPQMPATPYNTTPTQMPSASPPTNALPQPNTPQNIVPPTYYGTAPNPFIQPAPNPTSTQRRRPVNNSYPTTSTGQPTPPTTTPAPSPYNFNEF